MGKMKKPAKSVITLDPQDFHDAQYIGSNIGVSGQFPDGLLPDGHFPSGQFPEGVPRTDNLPNGHFPDRQFPE